ncbi:phosphate ABC transporter membrane protein 1, PhoT family [Halothece sp. PCC 7418]|uniref:phosphate ABC transporter permease subunit PstC n=1 Tax=Halothece sp. (strain PCC 7418) TaxID=65093 RepID=UPI0002A0883B|nr:phosphate ABC transporter permease subunit PstC [Halothece sp. PCC 7418]AFZ45386.1 phosphate ABC transporter membrane protein 1, PhoT family [Halothece sp. PCC 7418]
MTGNQTENLFQPNRGFSKLSERAVVFLFGFFALISIMTTLGIVLTLASETFAFFQEIPLWRFLTDTEWTPLFVNPQYGIFVLLSGTFLTSVIAITVALPIGLLSAIYLSEYAPTKVRRLIKPALEVLAGVPSVVFGYFALLFVTPLLQSFIPNLQGFNALSAGLVMGISITPLVGSISEDAIYSVPQSLRQGAYAMGCTKKEVVIGVVIPAALSGIVASFILAISRAVGETMIVTVAAGQNPTLTLNPFVSVQTMTSFIVQVSLGDAPTGTLAYNTLFVVGTTLFLITLLLNVFSFWFVRKFREKYE